MDYWFATLTEIAAKVAAHTAFSAFILFASVLLLRRWLLRGGVKGDSFAGSTRMAPNILVIGLASGIFTFLLVVIGLTSPESLETPTDRYIWGSLVGVFTCGSMLMLMLSRFKWEWDQRGIRWSTMFRTVSLQWSEISKAGQTMDGRFFVANSRDERIYWDEFMPKHQDLRRAIEAARPHLVLPPTNAGKDAKKKAATIVARR